MYMPMDEFPILNSSIILYDLTVNDITRVQVFVIFSYLAVAEPSIHLRIHGLSMN